MKYNIKKFFRINIVILIFAISAIIVPFHFGSIKLNNMNEIETNLIASSFKSEGFLGGMKLDNTYYVDMSPIQSQVRGNTIFCEYFMRGKDIVYRDNFLINYHGKPISDSSLNSNECSISIELSKKFNVNIDDNINVRSNFVNYQFKVKYIFDNFYGKNHLIYDDSTPLAILGFNDKLFNNLNKKSCYCYSDDNMSFIDVPLLKSEEIRKIDESKTFIYGMFAIYLIALIFFIEIFSYRIQSDVQIYKKYGYSKLQLFNYILIDSVYKYLIVIGIPLIVTSIINACIFGFILDIYYIYGLTFVVGILISIIFQTVRARGLKHGK